MNDLTTKFYDLFKLKEYVEDSIRALEKQYLGLSMQVANATAVTDIVTTGKLAFKDLILRNEGSGDYYTDRIADLLDDLVEINETANIDISSVRGKYQTLVDQLSSVALKKAIDAKNSIISDIRGDISKLLEESFTGHEYEQLCYDNLTTQGGYEERIPPLDSDTLEFVTRRISPYSDWKYPGLHFGGRMKELTSIMVASDPLYVVDFLHTQVDATVTQFNDLYQRRICPYVINNTTYRYPLIDDTLLDLPQDQFSIILSWNLFIYMTKNVARKYLVNIFSLLRPGGMVMFNFNNCSLFEGCLAASSTILSYLSYDLLKEIAEEIGFEVHYSTDIPTSHELITSLGWIELKKPGKLSTIKAHQVLGRVI